MLRDRLLIESREPDACHLAILAGVHGDEQAGFHAIDALIDRLHRQPLLRGRLSLLPGNVAAAGKKHASRTAGGQDMNRLFLEPAQLEAEGLVAKGPDWDRAQQLASHLRDVDVLLDLHATSVPTAPFAVTDRVDDRARTMLAGFPVDRLLYDYPRCVPGTAIGFVQRHGGRSVAVACGEHRQARGVGAKLGLACAIALLRNLGMLEPGPAQGSFPSTRTRLLHRGCVRHPASFRYERWFKTDAVVEPGAVLGRDRSGQYLAPTASELRHMLGDDAPARLVAVIVRRPSRLAKCRPHEAYLLGASR
ncbi:MAG: succinylglutamate desuccinylase/aspartoacylase family protein [Myxococcota bacterium]